MDRSPANHRAPTHENRETLMLKSIYRLTVKLNTNVLSSTGG